MTAEEQRDDLLEYFLDCLEYELDDPDYERFRVTAQAWKAYYIVAKRMLRYGE